MRRKFLLSWFLMLLLITGNSSILNAQVAKIGETSYDNFASALSAAGGMTGDVTVEILGQVEFVDGMELDGNYSSISFTKGSDDAKMTINQTAGGDYLGAHGKTVSFNGLTLAKANPAWFGNSGHMGNYFSIQGGTVTYTNCIFPNGACTNTGTGIYNNCTFKNSSEYGLWVYDDAIVTVNGGTVDSKKGIKVYSEGEESVTSTLTVQNATFTANVTAKPAVAIAYAQSITLIGNTYNNTTSHVELDSGNDADCEGITFVAKDAEGKDISSEITAVDRSNSNASCGVLVDGKIYTTVTEAAKEVESGETITLLYNSTETVELPEGVLLDTNGYTAPNVTGGITPITDFASLKTALQQAGSYALMNNITVTEQINISQGTEVTLDLNGHKITASDKIYPINNDGILTINDNGEGGTIEGLGIRTGYTVNRSAFAELYINGGIFRNVYSEGAALYVHNGTVIINGGKFYGQNIAIANHGGNINAKDCYIDGYNYAIEAVSLTKINNATISGVCVINEYIAATNVTFYEARIGEAANYTSYRTLAEAVQAAESGDVVQIIKEGSYDLPEFREKTLTFEGVTLDKTKTSIKDYVNKSSQGMTGSTVNFKNLTINGANGNYNGLFHTAGVTYENCDIYGLRFLYSPTTFTNCAFNAAGVEHSFWTYGASNVTVTGCTFTYTDRAVNCYSENGANHELDITFSDCDFVYAGSSDKPAGAVEINSSSVKSMDVAFTNDCTAPEKGEMWYISSYDTDGGDNTIVKVNGETVFEVHPVAKIGDVEYKKLQKAINAAQNGETITLLRDCGENVTITQKADVKFTIDGAQQTMTGAITVDGKSATIMSAGVTIKNVKFNANNITTDAAINLGVYGDNNTRYTCNVTVDNCTFTGTGQTKVAVKSYTGGDKNLTITNCNVDNTMHSLAQVAGVENVTITNTVVNSKNGINVNSSKGDIVINKCVIDVTGYAFRTGVNGNDPVQPKINITESTLKSAEEMAVEIRGNVADGIDLTMTRNIVTVAEGQSHITGTNAKSKVNADANYWGEGLTGPVVDGTNVDVNSYYADEAREQLIVTALTLQQFVEKVTEGNGTYNGTFTEGGVEKKIKVKVVPVSGDARSTDDVRVPNRLQKYTNPEVYYAQYQRFSELTDVNISNVNFVFYPAAVTVTDAWNTAGATTTADNINGELQLLNTGSVSFANCSFEKMSVSPINAATLSVTLSTFNGLDAYAIKDIKATTATITGTTFTDCNGGFWFDNAPTTLTVTDNTFTGTGRRGAIQFSANGDYANTEMTVTDNNVTDGAFLWQLNNTISNAQLNAILDNNTYVTAFVEGSVELHLQGEGTANNPYLINDINDLKVFRDQVNAGVNNYAGKHVKLAANIDLNNEEWTPIGNVTYDSEYKPADASKVFSGVFNGNGKVISNLKVASTVGGVDKQANVGLFGMTGEGAVIEDLTLTNVNIKTDGRNVGALAGFAYKATLSNITVNGNIQIKGGNNVSGVAGMTRYHAMSATNINVIGDDGSAIVGNNIVGGIFAEIAPNGSAQTFESLSVKNVAITGVSGVGGIVGLLTTGAVDNVTVMNVVLTGRTDYQGNAMGRIRLGSIAGLMGGQYVTIANVITENVTAKNLDGNAVVLPIIGANYDASSNATEAKIGGTYYATLEAAFTAATEGQTITLLADATPALTSQKAITNAAVIDLGGKTLTLTEDDLYFGTTTFQNGNIVVDPSVNASTAVFWMFANQTLTFDNVELTATGVTGTYLIGINGGTGSNVNLLNGTKIIIDNESQAALSAVICDNGTGNNVKIKNSDIDVKNIGGRFYLGGTSGNITVDNTDIDLNGVKEGFYLRANQTLSIEGNTTIDVVLNETEGRYGINFTDVNYTYTVAQTATVNATVYEPVAIAQIGTTKYPTLQGAIAAANGNETITLLANVELSEAITLDKSVVLDLNGKTITTATDAIEVSGGNLTITDSSNDASGAVVSTDASDGEVIIVKNNGTFKLEKGNITSATYGIYIYTSGGNVEVAGGKVEVTGSNKDGMAIAVGSAAGSASISGGTIKANGINWPMHTWGGQISITGGTFDFEPNRDYVAYGHAITDNQDGTYTVSPVDRMIFIGTDAYYTLEEAFEAATENDVITITLAGKYIWPNKAIPAGVTVKGTVDGVVVDGNRTMINATTLTVENIDFTAINEAVYITNGEASNITFTYCSFTGNYSLLVDSAAENSVFTFNNCVFNGFTTFAGSVGKVNVNGGKINHRFVVRQDVTLENVVISEVEDAGIQIGTSDVVNNVNVNMTGCTVEDTNDDGTKPNINDLVVENNVADGSGNTVVVDDVIIYGGVAKIEKDGETTRFATLADAVSAALNGETIKLIWGEGNAPIAMNASLYGNKNVTITGTATVDWSKGFLFVGRGGEGDATLTFDNANLTSASNQASTGIHVSGREKNTNDKYDGTVNINNSTIVLDYLINKGTMTLDNSTLTVKNGFSVGGRPAGETESGGDATATITLNNNSKVVVNNHNGMGLGYEAIGVMNIYATSTFETTQSFLVTAKGTMNVNGGNVKTVGTLTNNGTINVTGESTLNIEKLEGSSIDLMDGAIIKNSTVGGEVFVAGNVTFRGDNTFAMLYDYGTLTGYYGTTANMEWTVEEGASLTLTDKARYGLGYGDNVTINGSITDAFEARENLTEDDRSLFMHGLVAQESSGWNCNSKLTVNDAYVVLGSNNSFGNKPGDYGGNYTFNFNNSVVDGSRITFYEASSITEFTFEDSDVKIGTFMTRDSDSKFTLKNSKVLSTAESNGTDEGNYNAGELTLLDKSSLTYSAAFTNTGTLNLDLSSKLTAPSVAGNGTINIDATDFDGNEICVISANMASFEGVINVEGAHYMKKANGIYVTGAQGTLTKAYTSATGYWGECGGNANESFVFKFFNDDTYMGQTSLNDVDNNIIDGDVYVSWSIKLDAESNTDQYWTMSWDIRPTLAMQPNRVEQWVDGVKVAECAVEPNWADNIFPVVAAVTGENDVILSYVNNTTGATLKDAFAAGGNVTILRDFNLSETVTVPTDKTVVLDLNGKAIAMTNNIITTTYAINNLGTLTIEDSSTDKTGSVSARGIYNGYDAEGNNVATAKITIEGGTFNAGGENGGAAVYNYGIADIKGGKFTSVGSYSLNNQSGASMTIADGVEATGGIYNSGATLTVNGGKISNSRSGAHTIYSWNSNVTLKDGEIHNENSNNATIFADGTSEVNIVDGTFTIKVVDASSSYLIDTDSKLNISGGEFTGGIRVQANGNMSITEGTYHNNHGNYIVYEEGSLVISGGTFCKNAKKFVEDNLAQGYALKELANGYYTVIQVAGTQTREFANPGWYWFSTYIQFENEEVALDQLQTALGGNASMIKGQHGFTNYSTYNGTGYWSSVASALTTLSTAEMYMIRTTAQSEVELTGSFVDYQNRDITLREGWNWIGYPVSQEMSLSDAIPAGALKDGDQIKSQFDGSATYYNRTLSNGTPLVGWSGQLTQLKPGYGYMFNSASERTFNYTTDGNGAKSTLNTIDYNGENHWFADATRYPNNMTVTAMLSIDGEIVKDNYEVAAFANGECRGSARPIYIEALDAYMLFMTIQGEDVENLTFKYYDVNYGTEYELNNTMVYSNDAIVGTIEEPYMFNLGILNIDETSVDQISIYPNPTTTGKEINLQAMCDKVEVFNALGVKVAEYTNVDSIDAIETAGIYVIRVTIDGNARNCRLIVR